MNTAVEFRSEAFHPFLPEDSQVNPGVYGAELAFWLAEKLAAHGIVTSYPNYEDWGWFIEYVTAEEDEFWLCCGNVGGERKNWLCYIDPKAKGMFGRRKASIESASPLLEALRVVLEEAPEVSNIAWRESV